LELYGRCEPLGHFTALSLSQSKARLMSPLMEMTPRGPDIIRTK
jgi:hypothetical protein